MRVWRAWVVAGFLLVVGGSVAAAQSGPDSAGAEAQRAEMKKLDWIVGQWKGEGWIQMGPKRQDFVGTESVRRKVGGVALLVEGNFRAKGAPPDAPPVHETIAVVSYGTRAITGSTPG